MTSQGPVRRSRPPAPNQVLPTPPLPPAVPESDFAWPHPDAGSSRRWEGAARAFAVAFLFTLVIALLGLAVAIVGYVYIAVNLPAPEELTRRSATFVSTKIFDRNGALLYEIFDPHGGRRTLVPLTRISPYLIQATIATEDRNFYQHPGVDPVGLVRAIVKDVRAGEMVAGGSTIPQQLVKLTFFSPERTLKRKIKEGVLAAEITRRYSKDQILEIYLNEIFYGNLAYGVEAAAQTYFAKPAAELTLAEAALLAGIPQAPALYDPFTNPDLTRERRRQVLHLMVKDGHITPAQADAADKEPLPKGMRPFDIRAPHLVMYVRQQLEARYGPEMLYKAGLQVYTTLDYRLQELGERVVLEQVTALKDRQVTNGALIALEPATGEILAMVGSRGFFDPQIDGQVNVTIRPRQPGSAIKPLTYLAAFEKGWTPATLIWDTPAEFPDGANPPYKPTNYDGKFRGPALVRQALGNSLNVPAVKTLQFVGLPALLEMSRRFGITTLTRPDYGLSLTLGGGEVTLLELTAAYAVLANGGVRVAPVAILRVEDQAGQIVEKFEPRPGQQVVSPQHAYLITHILADDAARQPGFSPNGPLRLSRPAAAKTGTTNDYRDNWTIGYTPDLAAGVWVGNNNNAQMRNLPGIAGAAPIWHNFMEGALAGRPATDFARPAGIEEIEICADSGTLPSEACPRRRRELFAAGQGPLGPEYDFHQMIAIDISTGQRAVEGCPPELVQRKPFEVYPAEALEWARANNRPIAPAEECSLHGAGARVAIFDPQPEQRVAGQTPIFGAVLLPDLAQFSIEYGEGPDPLGWGHVAGPFSAPVEGGLLAIWNTVGLKNMDYTLRVVAVNRQGQGREARVHVIVENVQPTATATPSRLPSVTPTSPSATATPSRPSTATPTSPGVTATASPSPPVILTVTATPTQPATVQPTPTRTVAPTVTPSATRSPALLAQISAPTQGATLSGTVEIRGSAAGPGFVGYSLAYAPADAPANWAPIIETNVAVQAGVLGLWETKGLPAGEYQLRLLVLGAPGETREVIVNVSLAPPPDGVVLTPKPGNTMPGAP